MSRTRKTITENAMLDEIVYNLQQLINGIVLKDEEEALNNETQLSIKQSDIFMAIKEDRLEFSSFKYTQKILSHIEAFSEDEIKSYTLDNSQIPEEYREELLRYAEELFIDNYEEQNNYYRRLYGLPDYGESGLYVTPSDVDGVTGNIWKQLKPVQNIPIHQWEELYISIMISTGYMDKLKENNPEAKYLNFLNDRKIDIYSARKANKFECIYIPSCDSVIVKNDYLELLEKNRIVFLKSIYSEAYKFESEYYDKFMIIMIILQSATDLISRLPLFIIRRDFWEARTIEYLFNANGIPYYKEIPIKYQLSFVSNLNKLIKYKSTDRNIMDICSLFGFESMKLFKYYILKDRKLNLVGEYNYSMCESNKWVKSALPFTGKWNVVCYGNNGFVTVIPDTNIGAYSEDGIRWIQLVLPASAKWVDCCFSNGIYLLVSKATDNTFTYAYSLNGKVWKSDTIKDFDSSKVVGITAADLYGQYILVMEDSFYLSKIGEYKFTKANTNIILNSGNSFISCVTPYIYGETGLLIATKQGILYKATIENKSIMLSEEYKDIPEDMYEVSKVPLYSETKDIYLCPASSVITDKIYYIDSEKNYMTKQLPESRSWSDFFIANNIFVVVPTINDITAKSCISYYSIDYGDTWKPLEMSETAYWNKLCYGNQKFIVIGGKDYSSTATGYFKYSEKVTADNSNKLDTSLYNNTDNYNLKFIKTEIDGNVINSLMDPLNVYEYYTVISQDDYWEGDYERDEVTQAILDHEFNILRTKYYSIENICELTEMSFELSYFMNIIMNTDACKELTMPLTFIDSATQFNIVDIFILLYALSYEYYGISDNIIFNGSGVLTIRAFNFEADLTKLSEYMLDKGYDLTELCGGNVFEQPSNISTYKQLMYVYENNRGIYTHITNAMLESQNKDIYDIYKKLYDALFIADLNRKNYSYTDEAGNVLYTYSTYTAYLAANNIVLYNYLLSIKAITNMDDKIDKISSVMNDISSYVEKYTNLKELGDIEYLWSGLPTLSMDFVRSYINKMISYFKSFKAHILNISTIYKFTDKYDNMMFWIDRMHFDFIFDKAEVIKLYEALQNSVDLTYKEKVEICDIIDTVAFSIVNSKYSETIKISDIIPDCIRTYIRSDKFELDEKIIEFLLSNFQNEEFYTKDIYLREFYETFKDTGFNMRSKMRMRNFYPVNIKDRSKVYTD